MATRFNLKTFLEHEGNGRTVLAVNPGTVIMKQGSSAREVFYLVSGRAKETVASKQGKEALVGILEAGLFFGSGALDGERRRVSTVTALTTCVITTIEKEAMKNALGEPLLARSFMRYLLEHNIKIEAEKVDLLFNSSERRLAQRLLILAHVGQGEPETIRREITQEMLADMVGTTRPRVNLFLNRFRKLGLITYSDEGIDVLPGLLALVLDPPPKEGR